MAVLALAAFDLSTAADEMERAVIRGDQAALERLAGEFRDALGEPEDGDAARLRLAYAYTSWRLAAYQERGSSPYKALLKDAEKVLKKSIEQNPQDAEALALYGTVNGWLITGMWSGMRRGPRADRSYKKAREADPNNPRVAMLQGTSRLFRPAAFGGGIDKAETELTEALELFDKQPRDQPWPDGGHAENYAWMGQVMLKKGNFEEARAFYDKALALEPDYQWVRETLHPELQTEQAEASQSH